MIVKLKGLNPQGRYRLEGTEEIYSGSALMYGGVLLPIPREEYESYRYYFKEEEQPEA